MTTAPGFPRLLGDVGATHARWVWQAAPSDLLPDARSREGSGKSGGVRVIYFTRLAEGEVVLLTLYAKSKTDNLTGAKLKEIRRALEE